MAFSFEDLNLEGIVAAKGSKQLPKGKYVVKVTEAEVRKTATGGSQVYVNMSCDDGMIRMWINVHTPSSEAATRIGREQLKALCTFGGHSNPDKPGDISSLIGLEPGIRVVDESFKDKTTGEDRAGTKVSGFIDPKSVPKGLVSSSPSQPSVSTSKDLDDDIPF